MKKIYLILKFFITTINGKMRFSFLYPMVGIFIGSYSIFSTFSIMIGSDIYNNSWAVIVGIEKYV